LRNQAEKAKGTRGNIQQVLSGSCTMQPPDQTETLADLGIEKTDAFGMGRRIS